MRWRGKLLVKLEHRNNPGERNGTARKDCRGVKAVLVVGGLHRMYVAPRHGVYKICQLDFIGDLDGEKYFKFLKF